MNTAKKPLEKRIQLMKRRERDRARYARRKAEAARKVEKARVYAAWEEQEARGLVQWVCEPECEPVDSFEPMFEAYVEPGTRRKVTAEQAKEEWYAYINRVGIWMYATQYRIDESSPWQTADSIGGVDGNIKSTGYDVDLMSACLEALDKAYEAKANEYAERPTYAQA
jgi:hypothetical protein